MIASSISQAIVDYRKAWVKLLEQSDSLKLDARPTTLSIKVADKAALYKILQDNADNIEQVHIGTVNDRYIASAALKRPYQGLPILKILERRPGASDPLGLDSLDYLVNDIEQTFRALQNAGLAVLKEHNEVHEWLSLRFGDKNQFEAKFTDHLVLEVAIKELGLSIKKLL